MLIVRCVLLDLPDLLSESSFGKCRKQAIALVIFPENTHRWLLGSGPVALQASGVSDCCKGPSFTRRSKDSGRAHPNAKRQHPKHTRRHGMSIGERML
jgi:hypothetical protein